MCRGAISIAPLPRKWTVSTTLPSWASRRSCASSSRPVASGTGALGSSLDFPGGAGGGAPIRSHDDLLGADRVVALAPALVGAGDDLLAQLEDAVHQRLGARRAAGDVDGDRHELVSRND